MSWITLTATNVQSRISGAELAGVNSAALAAGQTAADVLAAALANVIKEVRGYVGVRNTLGEGETIPDELENATLAVIRYRLLTRLPNMKSLLDANRVKEYEDAIKLLDKVAEGKFAIVAASAAAASQATAQTPRITEKTLRYQRADEAGL